jgi:trk system potassium uptake protein TrkH
MSAISTGGFSSRTASLAGFDGTLAPAVLSVVSVLGAISFGLYSRMRSSGPRTLFADLELRALLAAILLTTVALAACQWWTASTAHISGSDFLITAVSAQTTTGFSSFAIADLSPASKAVLIVSMTIGGDFGSTAGGIKIGRALILLRVMQLLVLRRSMSAHAVVDVRSGGRRVQPADVEAALALVVLYLVAIFGSWLAFLAGGHDPLDSLFEVTSAMGTVGLSTGITGADLAPFLKGVLCVDMWLGRLEILPAIVLLQPRAWIADGGRTR